MPSGAAWALHFLTLWGLGIVALYWDARFLDKIHRQLLGETFSGGRRGGGREVGLELSCGCAGHGRVPPAGFLFGAPNTASVSTPPPIHLPAERCPQAPPLVG